MLVLPKLLATCEEGDPRRSRSLLRRSSMLPPLKCIFQANNPNVYLTRQRPRSRPAHAWNRQRLSPRVPVVPSRSLRVVPKKRVGREPGSRANPVNRSSGNARIDVRAKRRVPANQASARANELRGVRPRMRPKKKKTPSNFRNRSLGGNKLERTLRLRADSFELYKACCLDRDQILLAQTAHTRVEEHLAHVLMQASAFGHNLALKCSMFRNDKANAEKKIRELEQSLESAKAAEKEALEAKTAADAQVAALGSQLSAAIEEGRQQVVVALEQGRTDGFSTSRLAGKTEGVIKGRETFLQSDEYKQSLAHARLQGARDFLKSPVFKTAVDVQSAQFLNDGFDKCIPQVVHLKGFAEGFDQSRLDSSLDGQLQPYPPETASNPSEEDEFASLIKEIGYVP
ncbi:hypothetical protein Salat_1502900 [Sesamum alatum]|uniref:Uncharacterized protein n=1 Tax=Sesamum alatum TaxID=300844 RepID=A0AAE2CM83_9LAMI|nr:hypothetical protein Salat_1502900 [Sesamum alatum]